MENVLSLVSSLCKICDNDVVGISLRCSGQVCKVPFGPRQILEDFTKKSSFLPLTWCLHSLFCCMYLFRKQSNKANIRHIEDVHFVYYQFSTCSVLYHYFLSRSHMHLNDMYLDCMSSVSGCIFCSAAVVVGGASLHDRILITCSLTACLLSGYMYAD